MHISAAAAGGDERVAVQETAIDFNPRACDFLHRRRIHIRRQTSDHRFS